MLSLIALTFLTTPYFPLEAGRVWQYEVVVDHSAIRAIQTMRCLEPISIAGTRATPLQVLIDEKPDNVAYYAESEGFVKLVAQSEKELLPQAVPVLPVLPRKGQKWEFTGQTQVLGQPAPSSTKAVVVGFEKAEVLGKLTEILKVETRGKIGSGKAAFETKTTEHYAQGIGLTYRRQEMLGKKPGGATIVLKSVSGGENR